MPLSAVFFDLDGTLVDTNNLHVEAWLAALEGCGYRVARDRIFDEVGKGGDHFVKSLLGKEAEQRDGDALREAQPREFARLAGKNGIRVFADAVELLSRIRKRGLKTALASSSNEAQLDVIVQASGVDWPRLVDVVTTAADAKRSKPSPDIVSAAVRKLGLSPAECALVGDTPYDVQASRDGGVVCLGVESGGHSAETLRAAGARRVFNDVADLLGQLDSALHAAAPGSLRLTQSAMENLMREALAAAERGLSAGEAPIGCVLARGDGTVLSAAYNALNGTNDRTAHAEMVAFQKAAPVISPDADDLLLVSTLEPCVMCLGAAMEASVETVIYGLKAPADSGTGRLSPPQSPEARMPRIVGDVLARESRQLFERFLQRRDVNPKQAEFVKQLLALT